MIICSPSPETVKHVSGEGVGGEAYAARGVFITATRPVPSVLIPSGRLRHELWWRVEYPGVARCAWSGLLQQRRAEGLRPDRAAKLKRIEQHHFHASHPSATRQMRQRLLHPDRARV